MKAFKSYVPSILLHALCYLFFRGAFEFLDIIVPFQYRWIKLVSAFVVYMTSMYYLHKLTTK